MKIRKLQLLTVCLLMLLESPFINNLYAIDFPEINAVQLKSKMDSGEKLLLINPLSDIEFKAKHIPGSVNIPLQILLITEELPEDKDQLIITYCLGRKCIVSKDAAELVAKRGYTNIMVFQDGIPGWLKAGFQINSNLPDKKTIVKEIEPAQLNQTLDDYLVVDIRPESTYKLGYIPESRAMPMTYLSLLSTELPMDSKIMVVDYSGKRCRKAAKWLIGEGFEDVSILKGGLTAYSEAGFELVK